MNDIEFTIDWNSLGFTDEDKHYIANLFQIKLREREPVDTGYGRSNTTVEVNEDELIVKMPYYMMALNRGYDPFIMWGLEGKTIPIRLPSGQLIFRKAVDVGGHRITNRDPRTGQILAGNRPIKWRHPGHSPMKFIEKTMADISPLAAQMYGKRILEQVFSEINKAKLDRASRK